jgi:predicted alpha/beta hydrolase
MREAIQIPARDGYLLGATLFLPKTKTRDVVIINPATAVTQGLYAKYAQFLAENGYLAITYDYRGTGRSTPDNIQSSDSKLRDWAMLDIAGVIDWVDFEHQPSRIFIVGHSAGGNLMPMVDNHHKVRAMVTIVAQNGYWGFAPYPEKIRLWFFWYVLFPLMLKVFGYFPVSRFKMGEDLPYGVMHEWLHWCREPDYYFKDPSLTLYHDAITMPILAYAIPDDPWGTPGAVDSLHSYYTQAPVIRRDIDAEALGVKKVGHFDFFRDKFRDTLWLESLAWLQANQSEVAGSPSLLQKNRSV